MSTPWNKKEFEKAFEKSLGVPPAEFVRNKLAAGSRTEDVRYYFEMIAADIAHKNGCKSVDFLEYYTPGMETKTGPGESPQKEKAAMETNRKRYHKLVRDRIPELIERAGKECVWESVPQEQYLELLDQKLNEELAEYQESKSLEELADLLEVLGAVVTARGYTWSQLTALRKEKKEKRGAFEKRILLKEVYTPAPKQGQTRPSNAGKPWSKEEEARLLKEFSSESDIPALARQHGRTEKAIRKRLELLGKLEPTPE